MAKRKLSNNKARGLISALLSELNRIKKDNGDYFETENILADFWRETKRILKNWEKVYGTAELDKFIKKVALISPFMGRNKGPLGRFGEGDIVCDCKFCHRRTYYKGDGVKIYKLPHRKGCIQLRFLIATGLRRGVKDANFGPRKGDENAEMENEISSWIKVVRRIRKIYS